MQLSKLRYEYGVYQKITHIVAGGQFGGVETKPNIVNKQ